MTIGVVVPRGNVGTQVLRMLVQAGHRPRALLHDPDLLANTVTHHVETAVCEARDQQVTDDARACGDSGGFHAGTAAHLGHDHTHHLA